MIASLELTLADRRSEKFTCNFTGC